MACFARSASTRKRCRGRVRFYRRIVTLLEHGISRGAVAAGQQLPPERDLATAMKISRATVVSAYRELEARGLVRGYVGRGTFVAARPDAASAPFAWRGKIAASALQATDFTTVRDLVRAAADPSSDLGGGRRAGARLFPDRGVSARDEPRAHHAGRCAPGGTVRPKGSSRSGRRWRIGLAAIRNTSSCSPAHSRVSTCSPAAWSIPATPSSSIGPAISAPSRRSAARARASSDGTSRAPTLTNWKSCCCATGRS